MYMYINTHTSNDSHIFSLKEVGNSSTMCMSLCSRVGLRFLKSPSIISSGRRALWTSSISLCEVSAINWKGEGGRGGRGEGWRGGGGMEGWREGEREGEGGGEGGEGEGEGRGERGQVRGEGEGKMNTITYTHVHYGTH